MRSITFALILACVRFGFQAHAAQQNQPSPGSSFGKKEAALGAQLASQVRRDTTPLRLVEVERYVDKLGRELAHHMPNSPENWHFSLIKDRDDSSTYEPISLPGGWIFIPAQLILVSNDEGEFVGMLAHAMAHVALRQGVHRQALADVTYLAVIPGILMGPGRFGQDIENGSAPVGYLNVQRNYEMQADETAVNAMAAADFNPTDLLNYIAHVQPINTKLPEALCPMPSRAVRISNLERAIQSLSLSDPRRSPESFHLLQDEVRNEIARQQSAASPGNQVHRVPSLIHPEGR